MKALKPGDFSRTDVETNKQFKLTETASSLIYARGEKQIGTFRTESAEKSGDFFKGPLFGTIKAQFYQEPYRPRTTQSLQDTASIIQVAPRLFDEKIKEGSVSLVSGSDTFIDDSQGNLYLSGSFDTKIGNVFYEFGSIVITDTGSYVNVGSGSFSLTFRATHTKTQLDFSATVLPSEMNYSTNKSARINGKSTLERPRFSYTVASISSSYGEPIISRSIIPEFFGLNPSQSSEEFLTPYVTTIGFYNEANELLAIGKLATPTPKPRDFPITFKARIDI